MKRKISVSLALVAALLLMTAVAAAAALISWNVLDFLFEGNKNDQPRENAVPFVQPVHEEHTDGQVTLSIDSALCDGQYLAFDWAISNNQPTDAVYTFVEQFTANGVQLHTDGTDEFDQIWLGEGWDGNGNMQNGTFIELPNELKDADQLDVIMTVGVYKPTIPIYVISDTDEHYRLGFDPALALQKMEEGYLVRNDFDGWVIQDENEEDGIAVIAGYRPQPTDPFARTELAFHFTLDISAAREASVLFKPQEEYDRELFTARYDRAMITPLGMYLDLVVTPKDGDGQTAYDALYAENARVTLTDETGTPLDAGWPMGEQYGLNPREIHLFYNGMAYAELPDTIALAFIRDDGTGTVNDIFPIGVF